MLIHYTLDSVVNGNAGNYFTFRTSWVHAARDGNLAKPMLRLLFEEVSI